MLGALRSHRCLRCGWLKTLEQRRYAALLPREGLLLIEVMTSFIYRGWIYIVIQHTDVTANGWENTAGTFQVGLLCFCAPIFCVFINYYIEMGKVRLKSYEVTWFGDLSIELPPLELLRHHWLISFFTVFTFTAHIVSFSGPSGSCYQHGSSIKRGKVCKTVRTQENTPLTPLKWVYWDQEDREDLD